MAKISLILNVVLIIAVAILFFFQFSDNDGEANDTLNQFDNNNNQSLNIAYVQTDSILSNYELVKKLAGELEAETLKLDKDFSTKQKAFEKDAAYFQEQVDKQTISNESAQAIYEQLMAKQQELYELEQRYMNILSVKEMTMQQAILDSLRSKLAVMNTNQQFDFILSYNAVSNILIANEAFDITSSVTEKLNEDYKDQE